MGLAPELLERVDRQVEAHVRQSKGFEQDSMINPLVPVDTVAALAIAKQLIEQSRFDAFVAVATEGHVYGYFFEQFGAAVLSVHVDYPPRRCVLLDDFAVIKGQRLLILEDDVASGTTLHLVIDELENFKPNSMDLYLGRPKANQTLENIDSRVNKVFLAEEHLSAADRPRHEDEFRSHFL